MSSDLVMDENLSQTNGNRNKGNQKSLVTKERRVLGSLPLQSSSNVLADNHLKNKPKGLQQTLKNRDNGNKSTKTGFGQKSSEFQIFCDQSDSEFNTSNIENDFDVDITFDENKEEMESCDETDHILSERTENSLAIEEANIEGFSEHDIRCEETIEIETDYEDEELEEASASERTSEAFRSFDMTALSRCKEYANEIHNYLMFYERKRMADPFYIAKQPEINAKMRSILIDWMVEVTEEYKLLDQTLFLAVNYIDRFLSLMSVSRQSFQLLGTTALFIASKYEEIYPPELTEFVYITDDSYSKLQILNMERLVLKALKFDVSVPTTYYFIEKFSAELDLEPIVKHLAKYLCHLTLLESEPFLRYYPSEIAVSALILSAQTLGLRQLITNQFIENTIEYEKELKSGNVNHFLSERQTCVEALHRMHAFAHKHPQQAIQTKYTSEKCYRVSMVEPMATSPHIY